MPVAERPKISDLCASCGHRRDKHDEDSGCFELIGPGRDELCGCDGFEEGAE